MFRKAFLLAAAVTVVSTAAIAQNTEDKKIALAPGVMSIAIDSSGGYLGVQTKDVNNENFASFGLSSVRGVAVEKVVEGSPADKAGLQNGDVIIRVNGEDVTGTRKLTRLVSEIAPDHTARVTVLRSGAEREMNITLGKRPMPAFENGAFRIARPDGVPFEFNFPSMPAVPDAPDFQRTVPRPPSAPSMPAFPRGDGDVYVFRSSGSRQIGIGITSLTKQLADNFGVKGGVMINNVRENSPAAQAGLKAGDIIVEVDGKEVDNELDVIRGISAKTEGDVTLSYVRSGTRNSVNVTPEAVKVGFENLFEAPNAPSPARPARPTSPPLPLNELMKPGRVL